MHCLDVEQEKIILMWKLLISEIKDSSSSWERSHIMKKSSKNRNHTVGASALDCKKSSSNFPINNDAYEGAMELPITVPNF